MFLIESDILYAIMKKEDSLKQSAKKVLKRSKELHCSSATIVEIFSVLKAIDKFSLAPKVSSLGNFANLRFLPVTPEVARKAAELHSTGLLTFFDSFHAGTAVVLGMTLVSSDDAYAKIPNLTFMPVEEYLSEVLHL